ncbi:MAG: hypothetical protein OEU09_14110 [Rhodospirillales bacterium]|nr:hypothetical protein [Rhodospirillales bacterium]MDH3912423.1 hypothetical protein [Rhodospirillales bacterium]
MPRDDTSLDLRSVLKDGFDWSEKRIMEREVAPAEAEALFNACNTSNRPLVSGRAEELTEAMKSGRFRFNGDTIRWDRNGELLDGQHRLIAVSMSGKTTRLLLVFGLDPEVFDTIDVGAKRSAADTIARLGEERYRSEIGSACQWLVRWQRGDMDRSDRPRKVSNSEVKGVYRDNLDLVTSVELCTSLRSIGTVGVLSAVHYRVAQRDPELARRMVATLKEPAGIGVTDPFYVFRDTMLEMRRRAGRRDAIVVLALAIKAVNAAALGKGMKRLRWQRRGRTEGSFPTLSVPVKR